MTKRNGKEGKRDAGHPGVQSVLSANNRFIRRIVARGSRYGRDEWKNVGGVEQL